MDAVAAGQFQVYTAETIDQALELLTGYSATSVDASDRRPTGRTGRPGASVCPKENGKDDD